MGSIKNWIRSTANKVRNQPPHDPPGYLPPALPFLPTPFFRQSNLSRADENPSNYGLFAILTRELRRQILVNAFGNRTLHIDLSYSHPLVRTAGASSAPPTSGHRHCRLFSVLVPDRSSPKRWQWFGCVCHRRGDYSASEREQRYASMQVLQTVEPCDDGCLEASEAMCICPAAESSESCFLGGMGWLLSCQEA
jgi:hypothetical protein